MTVIAIDSSTWAALAAWATFALIAVGLVYARRQLNEAKALREEQTRPFVVVDFDMDFLIHLVVQNVGPTIARNVRVEFDPPLVSSLTDPSYEHSTLFTDGIPTLAPGRSIRWVFDSSLALFNDERNDLPAIYTVTVRYERPNGRAVEPDTYVLDFRPYRGSVLPAAKLEKVLKDNLEEINKTLSRWTDGLNGLRIVDRTKSVEEAEAQWERRFAQHRDAARAADREGGPEL